ncbi:expressed unknown protein [Seminavis robusta]|uniref:Uncharacterized protein n=1 Tax=Seminavis robusta TaxID=568900 RepID=A0A9N8HTW1_9STRA|nr:expressed unknown protein [Seminavis robusta]|eukprot:Sro1654_g288930.1 n/a (208) ;mRNA; r:23011-23634
MALPLDALAWTQHSGSPRRPHFLEKSHDNKNTNNAPAPALVDRRSLFGAATLPLLLVFPSQPSVAAPPKEASVFLDKKLTAEDAKQRFQLARKEMQYLLDNYADISKKGGGDAVRNYLGTQGVTSSMYGIQKVLKLLQEESDDIVEYTETMEEFNAYFYQAEGAAYQSMFAEHSSSRSTPESLLATAKKDIQSMVKYMDQLAVQLNL